MSTATLELSKPRLTRNQIRGFWAAWGGWALDGMDSFIYAMVLVAIYTLWVPEQYRTECRASAFAFSTSVGRFAGAGITFLVGVGVRHFQTIGIPVALTAVAFVIGLLPIPFGEETKGKALPA